jgi:tetratricopeptide (TPR) repeat protein
VLDSQYANAKYFLGLSYERLGRREDAIKQFEGIKVTNPDNQEIELILSNLKAGKSPFTDARPPIDDQPERRSELPVRDAGGVTSGDTGVTN